MAYFGDAFKKLSIKEGGYVNDKDEYYDAVDCFRYCTNPYKY